MPDAFSTTLPNHCTCYLFITFAKNQSFILLQDRFLVDAHISTPRRPAVRRITENTRIRQRPSRFIATPSTRRSVGSQLRRITESTRIRQRRSRMSQLRRTTVESRTASQLRRTTGRTRVRQRRSWMGQLRRIESTKSSRRNNRKNQENVEHRMFRAGNWACPPTTAWPG